MLFEYTSVAFDLQTHLAITYVTDKYVNFVVT